MSNFGILGHTKTQGVGYNSTPGWEGKPDWKKRPKLLVSLCEILSCWVADWDMPCNYSSADQSLTAHHLFEFSLVARQHNEIQKRKKMKI